MVDDPGTAGSKPAKFAEVLRAMLSWSRQRDLCVHNAAAQLRIEYRPVPRIPLTLQQARLLWWEIDDVAAQRRPMCGRKRDAEYWLAWSGVPDVLRLLMLTAARRSEICRARREWLQLDERQLLVPYAKGHPRVLALGPNALAIFRQRFELTEGRSEYLFPSLTKHGAPLDGARVLELFHQLTTRTGLNRASPTTPGRRQFCLATLRNSLATWAKRKGKSIDTIAELLGHRDRKTTKRIYTIYAADPDALALVDAFDAELLTTHTQEVP